MSTPIAPNAPIAFVKDRTALLLMDLQHFTLGMVETSETVLARARRARQAALDAGMQVVHVRIGFTEDDHASVPAHHKIFADVARHGIAADDSEETRIHPDLAPEPHEHVVTKTRVGALITTDLDRFLRERGVDTLVLAGVTTSGVILSTVTDAADRDYRLAVLADACADPDPALHETLMDTVIARYADVITAESFAEAAGAAAAATAATA